jgi:hypothetical protein
MGKNDFLMQKRLLSIANSKETKAIECQEKTACQPGAYGTKPEGSVRGACHGKMDFSTCFR